MSLFNRAPKTIRELETEVMAAKVAVGLLGRMDETRVAHVTGTAHDSVIGSTATALAAGHGPEARSVLIKNGSPPQDPVGGPVWATITATAIQLIDEYSMRAGVPPSGQARRTPTLPPPTPPPAPTAAAPVPSPPPRPDSSQAGIASPAVKQRVQITFDDPVQPSPGAPPPAPSPPPAAKDRLVVGIPPGTNIPIPAPVTAPVPSANSPASPDEMVVSSLEFTCVQVASKRFESLSFRAVKLVGREVVAQVRPTDRTGLFVPVSFYINGKFEPGAVVTLEDRAIFAWVTGNIRIKNFEAVVPYNSVTAVKDSETEPTRTAPALPLITVTADNQWLLRIETTEASPKIPFLLGGVLTGASTFD